MSSGLSQDLARVPTVFAQIRHPGTELVQRAITHSRRGAASNGLILRAAVERDRDRRVARIRDERALRIEDLQPCLGAPLEPGKRPLDEGHVDLWHVPEDRRQETRLLHHLAFLRLQQPRFVHVQIQHADDRYEDDEQVEGKQPCPDLRRTPLQETSHAVP